MNAGGTAAAAAQDPEAYWNELLRPALEKTPDLPKKFLRDVRAARLTFGKRVHCPFLRPVFLAPQDEERVRAAAEVIAKLGERVAALALEEKALLAQFHLRPEEERLVRLPAGRGPASTASRVDAFLLPDSLKFTEYNGESPAGSGYTETLAQIFRAMPVMKEFVRKFEVHSYPLSALLLDALMGTYRDWGGTSLKPQILITDWNEVPTWSEFEILKERFEKLRVPVVLADPRQLDWDGKKLAAKGKKIDFVYRRVLINDVVARPRECEALVKAYEAQAVCVANNFRCKIPHVKAFFAVLTEEKNGKLFSAEERGVIQQHVPWTRVVEDVKTDYRGKPIALLEHIRKNRSNLVLKPSDEYGGTGVTLGWETDAKQWELAIEAALPAEGQGCWIVQERIAMRRGEFPYIGANNKVEWKDMLVDFAPYLFRGKLAGFLTRLSVSSLANVTSGGGQIPSFRVEAKKGKN